VKPLLVALTVAACGGSVSGGDLGASQEAVSGPVCLGKHVIKGLDVSQFEGHPDWTAIKADGFLWAYIRANEGAGIVDSSFSWNWPRMKAAGVLRGAYTLLDPCHAVAPQMDVYLSKVGTLGPGDLPPMIDAEYNYYDSAGAGHFYCSGVTDASYSAAVSAAAAYLKKKTGRQPILYTFPYFGDHYMQDDGLTGMPMWTASYGGSCPYVANNYKHLTMWQDGFVTPHGWGGSGQADYDLFNGTLEELQALAGMQKPLEGSFDSASCSGLTGWAYNPNTPTTSTEVRLFVDAPWGGAERFTLTANGVRDDVCKAKGLSLCDLGFTSPTPLSLEDGKSHTLYAYALDTATGAFAQLSGSPKSIKCSAVLPSGALRHIPSPAAYTAWSFSAFWEQVGVPDTTIAQEVKEADWPAAPSLVRATGAAPVYVVDGHFRRHIADGTVAKAWSLDLSKTKVVSTTALDALTLGPDLPAKPVLIKGSGAPVYVIDALLPEADGGTAELDGGIELDAGFDDDAGTAFLDAGSDAGLGSDFDAGFDDDAGSPDGDGGSAGGQFIQGDMGTGATMAGCASGLGPGTYSLLALALLPLLRRRTAHTHVRR
jgi:lysozyme